MAIPGVTKPGTVTEERGREAAPGTSTDAPMRRLMLFASPVRRPTDQIATTLARLKVHNKLVTKAVREGAPPVGEVVRYSQDGVLVAFDPTAAADALYCAIVVMQRLREDDELADKLVTRIGLASGAILTENYGSEPYDWLGTPIEVAARLVLDVAKPGQIVLAKRTVEPADLEALAQRMANVSLSPVNGEPLRVDGMHDAIPVFELLWNGQELKVQNRRQLVRELALIQAASSRVRTSVKNSRYDLARKTVDDATFEAFKSWVEAFDPRAPGINFVDLDVQWGQAREAPRLDELVSLKEPMTTAYAALLETMDEQRGAVVEGGDGGEQAGVDCMDAFSDFTSAIENFCDRVASLRDEFERTL